MPIWPEGWGGAVTEEVSLTGTGSVVEFVAVVVGLLEGVGVGVEDTVGGQVPTPGDIAAGMNCGRKAAMVIT